MNAYDVFVYLMRWIFAVAFGVIGWGIIVANFGCVYAWVVRREHHSMMLIPAVAGIFALVGMALCPVQVVRKLAWVPLVVDLGFFLTVILVGLLMQLYVRRSRKQKQD
ncbi:MAG TPA: hypothetical protein VLT36_07980 [Candidatus Dormibacteraeota bacterium]|nr:hypothetical protein [Candidatus Dormibacteraeota bacterium]